MISLYVCASPLSFFGNGSVNTLEGQENTQSMTEELLEVIFPISSVLYRRLIYSENTVGD
jgi:hypothetical protein